MSYTRWMPPEYSSELSEDLLIPSRDEVKQAYQDAVLKLGQKTVEDAAKQFIIGDRVVNGDIKKAEKNYKVYLKEINGEKITKKQWEALDYDNAYAYESASWMYESVMKANRDKKISDFALGMGTITKNPKVKEYMIDTLKTKGYNAIVDEAGVGSLSFNGKTASREGQETLILFDRGKVLKEIKTEEITSSYNLYRDVNASKEALQKMRARKAI